MSRLFGLFCAEPVKLSCTQVSQPVEGGVLEIDRDIPPKADGWGIGFYRDQGSFLFKKSARASGTQRITRITEVISSHIFISHVRQATVGERKEANTHPFRWGAWLFAHQGTVAQFRRIRSRILRKLPPAYKKQIMGNTDTEHCFYLYLSLLRGEGGIKKGRISLQAATDGLKNFGTILDEFRRDAEVGEMPVLNFLISNSSYLLASRFGYPLYYLCHEKNTIEPATFFSPATWLQYELLQFDPSRKFVVVASEKLTASPNWKEVPDKHVLSVNATQKIEITPWL